MLQTLPPQVTVVNGTLTASSGSAALLSSNTIVWNGTSSTSTNYRMTTSNEDRTCCNECNDVLKADDDTVVRPWATTTGTSAWDLWLPTTRPFFDGAYSNLFITDRGFLSFQQPPLGLQNLPPTTSLTELYLGPRPAGLLTWKKLTNIGCQNWQVSCASTLSAVFNVPSHKVPRAGGVACLGFLAAGRITGCARGCRPAAGVKPDRWQCTSFLTFSNDTSQCFLLVFAHWKNNGHRLLGVSGAPGPQSRHGGNWKGVKMRKDQITTWVSNGLLSER